MKQKFDDALVAAALNGELTPEMAKEWLEGDARDLAFLLACDEKLREALRYLLEIGFSIEEYTSVWRKVRNQ